VSGYHVPVMVEPVLRFILEAPPGAFVDGTLGGGGHTFAIAQALAERGQRRVLVGIDRDPDALAHATERLSAVADFRAVSGNFRDLDQHVAAALAGEPVAAVLLDLGVSSHQLDAGPRGFAIKHPDAALDMRMDPRVGLSARELIAASDEVELTAILRDLGEVRDARRFAGRIKEADLAGKLHTTGDLARLIESATPWAQRKHGAHPATLVFQALRIAVNDELGALDQVLTSAPTVLMPGGRLLVMSYHSLEDRRVKQAFAEGERGPERPARLPPPSDWRPTWQTLTRGVITADEQEVAANPRARSAKLRVAEMVRGLTAHKRDPKAAGGSASFKRATGKSKSPTSTRGVA